MENRKRSSSYDRDIGTAKRKALEDNNAEETENVENEQAEVSPDSDNAAAITAVQNFLSNNPIISNLSLEKQKELFNTVLDSNNRLSTTESQGKGLWDIIPSEIREKLEIHQEEGIKFLLDRVIGNAENFDENGNGAILAHNMGLGKTLTIIVFLYSVLSFFQKKNNVPNILLVVPKNVIEQWKSEIKAWINKNEEIRGKIKIVDTVPKKDRVTNITKSVPEKIKEWHETKNVKQVLLLTYEELTKYIKDETLTEHLSKTDVAIFDEAHRLKNDETKTYETAACIQTKRKIFVTGTPHQNNLMEFYTLVNLIAPGVLNSKEHFEFYFAEPIQNGQSKDAEPAEVRTMRIRCYALYEMLLKVVHRKSCKTLKELLVIRKNDFVKEIKKFEMTIKVRPSVIQNQLLNKYLERNDSITGLRKKQFFTDISAMGRLLAHPTLVHRMAEESATTYESRLEKQKVKFPNKEPYATLFTKEWMGVDAQFKKEEEFDYSLSYKLEILMDIIKQCEVKGDKLLIFSQYCYVLDYIEELLDKNKENWFDSNTAKSTENGHSWGWKRGVDYFRIDGKVPAKVRHANQENFNIHENKQCRLMLISTKAGALGTNLIGANRVVLFDGCWNPTIDTQSLYRTYRIKQTKDVYVYRLVTHGTMNEAIYKRQIDKEITSHRVLDKETLFNLFTKNELKIYVNDYVPESEKPILKHDFKDVIIDALVEKNAKMIVSVESHDSFFDPCENDELTDEEFLRERLGFEKWYKTKCV